MNQELIAYIKQRIAQGAVPAQIESDLLTQGWSVADIRAALGAAGAQVIPTPTPTPVPVPTVKPVAQTVAPSVVATPVALGAIPVQPVGAPIAAQQNLGYAGFWLRVVAAFIDASIFFVLGILVAVVASMLDLVSNTTYISSIAAIVLYVANALYFILMESSAKQATLGKRLCGLAVTSVAGEKISFLVAVGRFFGKIVSALPFMIGFIMAGFTEKKQTLHDMMAKTVVVKRVQRPVGKIVVALISVLIALSVLGFFAVRSLLNNMFSSFGTSIETSLDSQPYSEDCASYGDPQLYSDCLDAAEATKSASSLGTAGALSAEGYAPYLASDATELAAQLEGDEDYDSATADVTGPFVVYYDEFWGLAIAALPIPGLAGQDELTHVNIDSITSKSGTEINNAESAFEQDVFFTELDFEEKTSPVMHLYDTRNLHLLGDAQEEDIKSIEGRIMLVLPLADGTLLEREFPFEIVL